MSLRALSFAFTLVALGIAGNGEASSPAREADPGCLSLRFRADAGALPSASGRFSATEILDLRIQILLPASLGGDHRLDVKIYTPDEHLYQVLTVPFRGADPRGPTEEKAARSRRRRKLPDHPRALDAPVARRGESRRHAIVEATLPVAGTSIVSSSLYGTWTAVAFLDGGTEACTAPKPFVITE